ncbi:hypothetical protein BH09GEM1_BH09GEM1_35590 [soil metagenome]
MVLRTIALIGAAVLLVVGVWLGYIAVIALRRSEGVFLPAGYVAVLCLTGCGFLVRIALKGL